MVNDTTKRSSNTFTPTRYYWCVRCGHHGDFGKVYKNRKNCEKCDYDDVLDFSYKDIEEDSRLCLSKFKKV